jgi:hypothetical protein
MCDPCALNTISRKKFNFSTNATSVPLVLLAAEAVTHAFNFSTCQYVSLIDGKQPAATRSVTPNSLISEQQPHLSFCF